ncbi:Helix-turn-helix domain-containing protein [Amycolatopsis pretoriensis]|uniref:Helix-turn-helix domain-containing protein n=1 Tax=Amycolatopsis pretoriensis TaxID=218821 RepID=A0A1H5RCJ9_9PSEU|nr:helix-turn-helix transcriptional regulator [Amycolatopsis pretoriensis]SEF36102.1 Helix-turn-helix domain-containing protein [Amycolatopsis pretoriensis]
MAYYSVPAIRRLQLGRELKAWREKAGLTLEQAGGDLDISKSTLSRLEKGQGAIHPLHARAMAELYRLPEDDLVRVVDIAREAKRPNQNRIEGVSVNSYPALEAEAVSVRNFELAWVPGLLQTESFTRALYADSGTRERNHKLHVRMRRCERLRAENPLKLHAIVDETALVRRVAEPHVLVAQMLHIVELSELDNVQVQLLPADIGVHPGLRGAFSLLRFPEDTIGDLGYVDHAAGNLQLVKPTQISQLARRFSTLAKLALSEKESCELLLRLADQLSA